jgi:hypothetical protein
MSVTESLRRRKTMAGASGFSGDMPTDGDTGEDGADFSERMRKRNRACGSGAVFDAHDAGGDFSGTHPLAPGNFGENGVAGRVNVRGFEASSGARNILRHRLLGPRKTEGAHEDGERERNSGARAALAICGPGCGSRRQFELQRDLVPRVGAGLTRTTRAGVSGGIPEAEAASKGNTTQTREPDSQDSLRCTRMPLRETSSVCVDSIRMPSGPRQRTRAGSLSWARGCLRNSRDLGAGIRSAYPSRTGGVGQILTWIS